MNVPILATEHRWSCPNCDLEDVTHEPRPHTRMHICRNGMSTPMVPAGTRCKVEHLEREDYLGEDAGHVRLDENGTPIMAAVITRDDGEDRAVYAPTAKGSN